jgi:hypothetical protein
MIRAMNITFALDETLVSAAKATAARHGTSISALVRTALEQQVALDSEVQSHGSGGILQVLVDYSLGRTPRRVAMQGLGVSDYGDLLMLLNAAHLPHPIVPIAERTAMVGGMVAALRSDLPAR